MHGAMQGLWGGRSTPSLSEAAARRLRGSVEPPSSNCGKCMNDYTNQWGEQMRQERNCRSVKNFQERQKKGEKPPWEGGAPLFP